MNGDITSGLVDTAILGTMYDRRRALVRVVEGARSLCRPWLDPSDSFLVGRVELALQEGWVALCHAEEHRGHTVEHLEPTDPGRRYFEDLLSRPLARACHQHHFLQEQLRLCFIDQLPLEQRMLLAAQLRQDRQRCMVCMGTRLETLPDGPERRLIRSRRQSMEEEAAALDRRLTALGLPR